MRSSERVAVALLLAFGAAWTAGCVLAAAPAARCVARAERPNAGAAEAAAELQHAVERGPLYRVLAASSPVVSCEAEQVDARTVLAWRFRDGATLRVERDTAIEYTNQEARVGSSFSGSAKGVLARAERAAFGKAGCGIDWRVPTRADATRRNLSEFVGNVCNCEARIGRDARGRVQTLAFRTAC
jgi:hypothetical protein